MKIELKHPDYRGKHWTPNMSNKEITMKTYEIEKITNDKVKYYATVSSLSSRGYWEEIDARNIEQAKHAATMRFGDGYIGDQIRVVATGNSARINHMPYYYKTIGANTRWGYSD